MNKADTEICVVRQIINQWYRWRREWSREEEIEDGEIEIPKLKCCTNSSPIVHKLY
jgi:hypothetical protein